MLNQVPDKTAERLPDIIRRAKEIRKNQNEAGCGGTVLPGEYILNHCPDFLQRVSGDVRTIMVGGTNGKTTTTSMIVHMLRARGFRVFSNREGANKTEGIATAFGLHCDSEGKLDYDFAVVECDELFLLPMATVLKPEVLVLTNLYKDQVERLISAEHTAKEIIRAISTLTDCTLCLNRDMNFYEDFSEAYHGTRRIPYRLASEHTVEIDGSFHEMTVDLPMKYNLENVVAAAAALYAVEQLFPESFDCFMDYKLPFGRFDRIALPNSEIRVVLAKNQIALERICAELSEPLSGCTLFMCYEYPPDFLWLEDLDPETCRNIGRAERICVLGDCAEELDRIIRKNFTGHSSVEILSDEQAVHLLQTAKQPVLAIVGYCGMLRLNKLLAAEKYTKEFWEE